MNTQEEQIALLVRKIDQLKQSRDQHWKNARSAVNKGNLDQAISLLNAHFSQEEELLQAEGQLRGILKGNYADR